MLNHPMCRMVLIAAAAIICPTAGAVAKDEPPKSNEGILSGPKVEQQAQSQPDRVRPDRKNDRRDQEISIRQWFAAVRELKLTTEQRDAIRSIMSDYFDDTRAFVNSITPQERDLLNQRGEADRPGDKAREIREALAKLNDRRPKPEDYEERIWQKLTDDQQSQLKEKFQAMRDQAEDRRVQRREDRMQPDENAPPTSASDPMMQENPANQRPTPDAMRNRRGRGDIGLDDLAQRRLRFLLARQSADAPNTPRHLDGEPSPGDLEFEFDDGDGRTPPPHNH